MTDERKNIKVSQETFEALKENKPDGWNWDYYLESLAFDHGEPVDPRGSMPQVEIERDVEPSDDAIDVAVLYDENPEGFEAELLRRLGATEDEIKETLDADVSIGDYKEPSKKYFGEEFDE